MARVSAWARARGYSRRFHYCAWRDGTIHDLCPRPIVGWLFRYEDGKFKDSYPICATHKPLALKKGASENPPKGSIDLLRDTPYSLIHKGD